MNTPLKGKRRCIMRAKKTTTAKAGNKAAKAYADVDKAFDPLGSYTGRAADGRPSQDADDL